MIDTKNIRTPAAAADLAGAVGPQARGALDGLKRQARRLKYSDRQAVAAFARLAERVERGEKPPAGFDAAVTHGVAGLYDHVTGVSTASRRLQQAVQDQFHRLYYHPGKTTWKDTHFLGVRVLKSPFDLWTYQEILFDLRPDVIVECGTAHGGSAFYFATMCDLIDHGRIVTIDVAARKPLPEHPRITYLDGSSVDPQIVSQVDAMIGQGATVMVILDSDHSEAHVTKELQTWCDRVTPGSYLVVEDTNVNGHPVHLRHGAGPWEATDAFLKYHPEFQVDARCERHLNSFNPRGYLKKNA